MCPWRGQENRKESQPRGSQTSLLPLGLFPNSKAKKEKPGLGKISNLHCTIGGVPGWFVTFTNTVCHEQHWGNNPQKYSCLKIASKTTSKWTINQIFAHFISIVTQKTVLFTKELLQKGNLKNILTGYYLEGIISIFFIICFFNFRMVVTRRN